MMTLTDTDSSLERWQSILTRLRHETRALSPDERDWIALRLVRIAEIQERMHQFFLSAGGARTCGECLGECCDRGKNHPTLANLLPYLLEGTNPPEPDFSRPCPYLGEGGCRFEPGRRPFTCVTFLCDEVEARLTPEERLAFYALEKELRRIYLDFDGRYAGSSQRGILIRAERLGDLPFLAPP